MKKITCSLLVLMMALAACTPAATAAQPTAKPGALIVDARSSLGPISPLVYGTNFGPWVPVPFGMQPDVEKLGITLVRFPAGSWGDNNNVQSYQIDQLMDFCKRIGAQPSISVRLKNGAPEEAAKLVHYANVEKGYRVRYWSIGNEPTLFAAELKEDYDTVRFNQEWRQFAEAMKAVDPEIQLLGPELHQFTANPDANPKDSAGRDWMTEFLKANGDLVDVVAVHRYPFPSGGSRPEETTIEDLRKNSAEWDEILPYLRGLIRETTGRDIPIAVTEVNSHWSKAIGGEASPDSHFNAVWWADVLGRMIRQKVVMVNHWMLASQAGQGGWGLVGRGELRPAYFTYRLYQKFGSDLVYAASGAPDLSIFAATRSDQALTLLLVNLGDEEKSALLELRGLKPSSAEAWLFDSTHQAEQVDAAQIFSNGSVTLPGQSVTLLALK